MPPLDNPFVVTLVNKLMAHVSTLARSSERSATAQERIAHALERLADAAEDRE